jgi:transcriptional regulator GlxA family with amidase domain
MGEVESFSRVAVVFFEGFELLDAVGPYEVLGAPRGPGLEPCFELRACALEPGPVRSCQGLVCDAPWPLSAALECDVILLPGGAGVRDDARHREIVSWLAGIEAGPLLGSVCTGAFLLARAGRTRGAQVTTHSLFRVELGRRWPQHTLGEERVIWQPGLVTSAGVTAGIDLALELIARAHGRAVASYVEGYVEWGGATLSG